MVECVGSSQLSAAKRDGTHVLRISKQIQDFVNEWDVLELLLEKQMTSSLLGQPAGVSLLMPFGRTRPRDYDRRLSQCRKLSQRRAPGSADDEIRCLHQGTDLTRVFEDEHSGPRLAFTTASHLSTQSGRVFSGKDHKLHPMRAQTFVPADELLVQRPSAVGASHNQHHRLCGIKLEQALGLMLFEMISGEQDR